MTERVDTPEAFLTLRLRVRELERQVEEAKSAAARTCIQGGAAAGEVLVKMENAMQEALSHLPPVARGDTVTLPRAEYEAARTALAGKGASSGRVVEVVVPACQAQMKGDSGETYDCALALSHFGQHVDAYGLVTWPNESEGPAATLETGPEPAVPSIPLIDHDYVPNTWPKRDECDKRVSDNPDGRPSRQCARPRRDHRG